MKKKKSLKPAPPKEPHFHPMCPSVTHQFSNYNHNSDPNRPNTVIGLTFIDQQSVKFKIVAADVAEPIKRDPTNSSQPTEPKACFLLGSGIILINADQTIPEESNRFPDILKAVLANPQSWIGKKIRRDGQLLLQ